MNTRFYSMNASSLSRVLVVAASFVFVFLSGCYKRYNDIAELEQQVASCNVKEIHIYFQSNRVSVGNEDMLNRLLQCITSKHRVTSPMGVFSRPCDVYFILNNGQAYWTAFYLIEDHLNISFGPDEQYYYRIEDTKVLHYLKKYLK